MTIDLRTPDAIKEIDIVCGSRRLSGRLAAPANGKPRGLIIALHGGSYTSRYFDTPGHSVLSAIAQLGYTVIGIDRPGYGAAKDWPLDFDYKSLSSSQRSKGFGASMGKTLASLSMVTRSAG